MPHFIVERTLDTIDQTVIDSIGQASREALGQVEGVVWIRSYVSESEGKMYCEYDAPSAELVLEVSRRAGMPVDRISEISMEISPEMFH